VDNKNPDSILIWGVQMRRSDVRFREVERQHLLSVNISACDLGFRFVGALVGAPAARFEGPSSIVNCEYGITAWGTGVCEVFEVLFNIARAECYVPCVRVAKRTISFIS
jgi:hypothetical protein